MNNGVCSSTVFAPKIDWASCSHNAKRNLKNTENSFKLLQYIVLYFYGLFLQCRLKPCLWNRGLNVLKWHFRIRNGSVPPSFNIYDTIVTPSSNGNLLPEKQVLISTLIPSWKLDWPLYASFWIEHWTPRNILKHPKVRLLKTVVPKLFCRAPLLKRKYFKTPPPLLFFLESLLCSPRLHLFVKKYSKHCNIVNLKYLFECFNI